VIVTDRSTEWHHINDDDETELIHRIVVELPNKHIRQSDPRLKLCRDCDGVITNVCQCEEPMSRLEKRKQEKRKLYIKKMAELTTDFSKGKDMIFIASTKDYAELIYQQMEDVEIPIKCKSVDYGGVAGLNQLLDQIKDEIS